MTDQTSPQDGERLWVPTGAIVIYPRDTVVEMFGHEDASSTRSMMARYGYSTMWRGWAVEEVDWVLKQLDPVMLERWRKRKAAEKQRRTGNG